jgi:NtrC-family two-component system response regulator AlgB
VIEKNDLPDIIFQSPAVLPSMSPEASLEEVEAEHIKRVLAHASTIEEAADILGIGIATLWRKRKRHHFD